MKDFSVPESTGLRGLRVLSLESRRAPEMAKLIESHGGIAVSAPSMREIPLGENSAALALAQDLFAGRVDVVLFLTGVGARILLGAIETKHAREILVDSLTRTFVVVRGPKPAAVLREFAVPISLQVPEPNTWRDILKAFDEYQPLSSLKGKRLAVQEYGVSNGELIQELERRGAIVTAVPVYQWALPEDIRPLERAIDEIVQGRIDMLLVTSATQVEHLMQIATRRKQKDTVRRALRRVVVGSIGPISTEALASHGIAADFEPAHPRMGQLVFEAAEKARGLRQGKLANGTP